jgi:rsbT co-antagonist protein RsbR
MNQALADILTAQLDPISRRYDERLAGLKGTAYEKMSAEQRLASAQRIVQSTIDDLAGRRTLEEHTRELATQKGRGQLYTIDTFKQAFRELHTLIQQQVAEVYPEGSTLRAQALADLNEALWRGTGGFYEAYSQQRETAQREREAELEYNAEEHSKLVDMLRELSSPIVPVHDSILVLPLVGAIDTKRAQTVTEDLLDAIVQRQADLVIIDITGVPVVDTAIANYLLQTTKAVNLLGTQVILVGISAEVAQTIVGLDLDLSRLTVRANLQDGIAFALAQLGLQITGIDPAERVAAQPV